MTDSFDLRRFVDAQGPGYDTVLAELRAGRKRTHWIWFVFPQLVGLGHSRMAERFGISGLDEARAYLDHPVLGPRLRECSGLVLAVEGRSAEQIFGYPDHLKVRSCMTLFARAAASADNGDGGDNGVFAAVLDTFYAGYPDGREDPATVRFLS